MNRACPPADTLLEFIAGELAEDRAATVESHIDDCIECRAALSSFARGDTPPSFGRYRIDTVLGSGGMGIVYRAWDPELGRPLAIKVLRSTGDDALGRARLVREAQSLARLSHPNVCHVYDVGSEGEDVWVAMELIDGVTLRHWAAERRTPEELLGVLLGAAEGLAAAHEAGLVHRDVKPENVLVTRDGRAIVTDFGLARAEDRIDPRASTLGADPHLTASGAIAGTPAYLAPEQLSGDPIDARVDQFAWAVMTWELLTGGKPFPAIFAVRLDAIRAGVTPPASLAPAIASVLARAMSAAPRDRFETLRDVIAALRETPAPAEKPRRTRAAALVAFGALAIGGVAVAWQMTSESVPSTSVPVPLPVPASGSGSVAAAGSAAAGSGSAAAPAPAVAAAIPHPAAAHRSPKPSPPSPTPPSAPPPAEPAISTGRTPPPAPPPPPGYDPAYSRTRALAVMIMECSIPTDFAHPDAKSDRDVVDWGKVIKVSDEHGDLGGRDETLHLVYVQGQRRTYKIRDDLGAVGIVPAKPGDLLALCTEDQIDIHQLASGPLDAVRTVVTLSAPPRTAELAKWSPRYIREIELVVDATSPKPRLDPDRHYLVYAHVQSADGPLWKMDRYWLAVPPAIPGASQIAANKRLWLVVEHPRHEEDTSGNRFVVTATAVLDELFP